MPTGFAPKSLPAASAALGLARESDRHGALEDACLASQLLRALHGRPPGRMNLHDPTNLRD